MALQRKEGTVRTCLMAASVQKVSSSYVLCGNNHPLSHCRVVWIMGILLYLYIEYNSCVCLPILHVFMCSAGCCSLAYATNICVKVIGQYRVSVLAVYHA